MLDLRSLGIVLAALAAPVALADGSNPHRDAYLESTQRLDSLVERAQDGRIDLARLRRERRRLEARLDRTLSELPVEFRPGELREVNQARAELNQSVMKSQEYEFFGPEDRPEWGWFPSRNPQSTGSTLTVEGDGRTRYSALR
jgi:glycine/D-amino acid oxidase-like deaminating enzyme